MPVDAVRQLLDELQSSSPEIKVSDRRYKAAYSRAVWALVEQVNAQNDQLERLTGQVENIVRLLVNRAIGKPRSAIRGKQKPILRSGKRAEGFKKPKSAA
jgi:hypothetical protein